MNWLDSVTYFLQKFQSLILHLTPSIVCSTSCTHYCCLFSIPFLTQHPHFSLNSLIMSFSYVLTPLSSRFLFFDLVVYAPPLLLKLNGNTYIVHITLNSLHEQRQAWMWHVCLPLVLLHALTWLNIANPSDAPKLY